jgi:polysaccharide export outer membrane protein
MLLPDDRLLVRGIEEYRPKRAVTVTGEVARPGTYVFSAETISLRAVIDSAGGFTPWADLSHALIVRPSLPVWMQENRDRLTQLPSDLRARSESDWLLAEALSYPGRVATDFVRLFNQGDESFNVPLVDGDRVLVPRLTEGINVIGRVVQPGMVPHRLGADLTYYLNRAGGYSSQADRGGTFLVKGTTGAAIKKRRIGEITAGDTIVVPTRRGRNWWTAFRETLTVATGLATMYLVIDQATN